MSLIVIIGLGGSAVFLMCIVNSLVWPRLRLTGDGKDASVSVLIPARDEERNIGNCLEAVIVQGDAVDEILVYNDHSTDNTAEIVRSIADSDPRVRLVPAVSLPPDWCGKPFACAELAKAAKGEWLLFLDADTVLAEGAIARMVAEAQARQVSLLSCWPRIAMGSMAEKILMPMLNFVVLSIFPTPVMLMRGSGVESRPGLGLAHGACILIDRGSYEAFGGHQRVRGEIFEDTRLAQLWRATGRRTICLDGQDAVSIRMYRSIKEIWFGFQKNFYPAFTSEWAFWSFLAFHFLIFLVPFGYLILMPGAESLVAAGVVIGSRAVLALRFRHPLLSVFLHPAAEIFLLAVGLSSWWLCRYGGGVSWKGREYRPR